MIHVRDSIQPLKQEPNSCQVYQPGIEVEIEEDPDDEDDDDPQRSELPAIFIIFHTIILILHFIAIRRRQYLMQLLRHFTANGALQIVDADDDEETPRWMRARRRNRPDPDRFPKVPSEKGQELMGLGTFGSNDTHRNRGSRPNHVQQKKRLARRVLDRELAIENCALRRENQSLMAQASLTRSAARVLLTFCRI